MHTISRLLAFAKAGKPDDRKLRARKRQAGQSIVEFALVLPMLLTLWVGVVELGRYAYIGILVEGASRAGAAYGVQSLAQSADTAGIQNAADNDFQNNGQNVTTLTVNSSLACGCDSAGTVTTQSCNGSGAGVCAPGSHWVVSVSVESKGTFGSIFHFPGIPASISLDRTCTMRVNTAG